MRNGYRDLGKVGCPFYGKEDHGILTCSLPIDFVEGSSQSFGNLCLDEQSGPAFVSSLCDLFGVKELTKIQGKQCYALRCWNKWSTDIEGLEVEGKRFLITEFRRRFWPEDTKTPLDNAKESALREIEWAKRRIQEAQTELEHLSDDYVDWESHPVSTR